MNLLHLEDSEADAELISELIAREWPDFTIERVQTQEDFTDALVNSRIDLILADVTLPGFDGISALQIARDIRPEVPFIFLSGTLREDDAIETLRNGATDYILKDRIGRLIPAIRRALSDVVDPSMPAPHDLSSRMELSFLHLEDSESDGELASDAIARDWPNAEIKRVQSREAFTAALQNPKLDMILSDFSMPGFDGMSALSIARSLRPEVPFIFVSGTIGEENAIAALKKGATDYIIKDRMRRLRPAIRRALEEFKDRRPGPQSGKAGAKPKAGNLEGGTGAGKIGLWDWDLLTNESWLSKGVFTTLGYLPGEISANVDVWAGMVHPDDKHRVAEKVLAALGGTRDRWSDEFRLRRKDGDFIPVQVDGMIARDETGGPVQMSGTFCRLP